MTKDFLQRLKSENILISDIRPRGTPFGNPIINPQGFVDILDKISCGVLPSSRHYNFEIRFKETRDD